MSINDRFRSGAGRIARTPGNLVTQSRARRQEPKEAWDEGLADEVAFWREYFATAGEPWPDDFKRRMSSDSPLEPHVARYIPAGATKAAVLDVGAGPLTSLGKTIPGIEVSVYAVDALADAYDRLIAETSYDPPVRTRQCETERLTEMFGAGEFDVVHARNTLDHSYDPLRAIRQMAEVTKPGGAVILHHYRNEAKNEGYQGLHRWNLAVEPSGRFVVSRPKKPWGMEHLDVAAELTDVLELVSTKDPHDEPAMDLVVFRRR